MSSNQFIDKPSQYPPVLNIDACITHHISTQYSRVLKPSLSTTEMIQVYNSLIRSHFEYCAPLFLGLSQTNKQRLEKLQRRFHTIICGKSCRKSCLVSLQERRQLLSLTFLRRVMCEGHVLHHFLPTRMNSGRFRLPPRRTTRRSLAFFPLASSVVTNEPVSPPLPVHS